MVAVPAATPDTTPVDEPMVAIVVGVLLHVPPPVASASVVVAPAHNDIVPVMPAGEALTVTAVVTKLVHPALLVTV